MNDFLTVEEEFAKQEEAKEIAIEFGAIYRCPIHSDVLIDSGDHEMAYKVGVARFRDNKLEAKFASVREVTDHIKVAIEDAGIGCMSCEKD